MVQSSYPKHLKNKSFILDDEMMVIQKMEVINLLNADNIVF